MSRDSCKRCPELRHPLPHARDVSGHRAQVSRDIGHGWGCGWESFDHAGRSSAAHLRPWFRENQARAGALSAGGLGLRDAVTLAIATYDDVAGGLIEAN